LAQNNFENNPGAISLARPSDITRANLDKKKRAASTVNYQLLRDAYFGTGGFADGTYLEKHKRERKEKYDTRRRLAYYLNYTAPAVNSHVDPIFRQEIKRDWSGQGSALFEKFIDDVDMAGTTLQNFARRVALGAKLYGVNFVVVDNAADQPPTLGAAIETRALPYAYIVEPDRVVDYATDRYGRLVMFAYREPVDRDNNKADADYNVRLWTKTGWELWDKERKKLLDSGQHNLGRVPVVVWSARELDPADILPPSEFGAIASTNLAIYQLCSWLTEILQNQAFSILVYPSNESTSLTIGTDNALQFPEDARHTPAFIAPPADPAQMLADQIDRLVQEIYRMANLTLVTGVKEQKSGIAKAWDFESTNQTLAGFAATCEAAEKKIAELFSLWTGQQIDYVVEYPCDFAIVDVAEELKNAQAAVDLNMGSRFNIEVAKKIMAAYLPKLDPETYDAIIADLEANATDRMMAAAGRYNATPRND